MRTRRRFRPVRPTAHLLRASLVVAALGLAGCGDTDDEVGGGAGDADDASLELPAADGSPLGPVAGDAPGDSGGEAPATTPSPGGADGDVDDGGDETDEGDGADVLPRADVRGIDQAYPYRADGPWADVLVRCALAEQIEDACTLTELPFVAQATPTPSVDDVMERVVVTHDWMGERLEEVLRAAPDGLAQLFAATTSITIGSTVRPAFYTAATGGVQLDPQYLWQTLEEKASISIEEDFRAPYRSLLSFQDHVLPIRGQGFAYEYFALDDRSVRTLEQAERPLMALLFHELSHANDFLPPGTAGLLDPALQPFDALVANRERWLSPRLQAQYPQYSTLLQRLAEVRFFGEEPTDEEAALGADVVGPEFAIDGGLDFYAYASIREDLARLFEAAMMKAVYDIDMHVAFTNQPPRADDGSDADYECDELVVGWGAGSRLGDESVAVRAGWVLAEIFGPSDAIDDFVAGQSGTQRPMTPGVGLCTNLRQGLGLASRSRDGIRGLPPEHMSHAERHALAARRGGPAR